MRYVVIKHDEHLRTREKERAKINPFYSCKRRKRCISTSDVIAMQNKKILKLGIMKS